MSWRMLETKYVDDKIESPTSLLSTDATDSQKSKSDYWVDFFIWLRVLMKLDGPKMMTDHFHLDHSFLQIVHFWEQVTI